MSTFFDSRWVDRPEHVYDLGARTALPAGFRAAGVAAGIKPSGGLDVGLLVCRRAGDHERRALHRLRRPRRARRSSPATARGSPRLRAVAVNAGNANAATGGRGMDAAAKMQGAGAMCAGVPEDQVAVASTGVIGVQLDSHKVVKGLLAARGRAARRTSRRFAESIRTTDAFPKQVDARRRALRRDGRDLRAQCKGAGMIQPNFATMLCFVQTDAQLASADGRPAARRDASSARSTAISVDGQLSTNDTAILMARVRAA